MGIVVLCVANKTAHVTSALCARCLQAFIEKLNVPDNLEDVEDMGI